jgi:dTMP kinase
MIDFWHGWFPVPDMVFWVDVPVDLAYGRKNDIPSIEYLVERKMLYEKLVKRFNFVRLDGSLPIEKITGQIKGYLKVIGSS